MSGKTWWSSHLVAHRGESADFPENTLLAMSSALKAGVCFLECDIQMSRDGEAMVIHDSRMGRTTAHKQGRVWDFDAHQLQAMAAGYDERFSGKFQGENIPSLRQLVALLQDWPKAHVFVELKRASLSHFGIDAMLDAVMPCLQSIAGRYSLISYNDEALQIAKQQYQQAIGWVSDVIDDSVLEKARQLAPDFLITDADSLDKKLVVANSNWRWMLFEVNDPNIAKDWIAAGVEFIETNRVKNYIVDS